MAMIKIYDSAGDEFFLPSTALSVRQPWAWAIIHGGKDIENRTTPAVNHGMGPRPIAIHASKGMTRDEYEDARDFMATQGVECPRPDKLIRGAVIGQVAVTAVVAESDSPWFFGPRGLVLANAVAVEPFPAIGALGYFDWWNDDDLLRAEFDPPKPWMAAWPDEHRRTPTAKPQPATMPLFD